MSDNARRTAGEPLSPEQLEELRMLADMPDSEIDFSDIPERSCEPQGESILEEHTLTLQVDAEVAAWLESAAREDPQRINRVLRLVAHRHRAIGGPQGVLSKAS